MTLFHVPIEPLEERYTIQWFKWFKEEFDRLRLLYIDVEGKALTTKVETGKVLDAFGTNFYKFKQLQDICVYFKTGKVHDGDKFFIADLWFPGIEAIPYMAELAGIKVDIYGFLHAGSYTTEDFASPMNPWARYFEYAWANICKKIFVGSQYHKDKFLKKRNIGNDPELEDKIIVTGNPLMINECPCEKENIIVFPNRFDQEKRPQEFLYIIDLLYKEGWFKDWKVYITSSRKKITQNWRLDKTLKTIQEKYPHTIVVKSGITKKEYYEILARSKIFVSTTIEENFGYCLAESLYFNCVPLVRDGFSHKEILHPSEDFEGHFFKDTSELADKLADMIKGINNGNKWNIFPELIERYRHSILKMLMEMELA